MPERLQDRPAPSRRAVVVTVALAPAAVALTGCNDNPAADAGTSGTRSPGGTASSSPGVVEETPAVDPAVVAALSAAATQVSQLSQLYASTIRKFPTRRGALAAGAKYHVSHLAKLKETPGVAAAPVAKAAVPAQPHTAQFAIAEQEEAAAAAHAAAAAKLSGAPARLLAEIAAAETQLASTLGPKLAKPQA
ncbi:cell division protein FtsK [Kribbella shirazensis]|uniref:Uncharacterized protein n=1 Tax=Kribbella shirazensis TaxID=1105143 RepID=A0A7X6A4K6_9ACTN|nr:cell division protein FtsK [Kribbella shirazensis]NIK60409.1 hypothetical protein [Kribbella shirazensis]